MAMQRTSDILFDYLRDVIYNPKIAKLDLEALDPEFLKLGQGLVFFAEQVNELNVFSQELSRGRLDAEPPPRQNVLAGPLKSLQGNLRHLSWQAGRVANGDYKQRVDFLGQFAESFNAMTNQLELREAQLEAEIENTKAQAKSLELGNKLLETITQGISKEIFIASTADNAILMMNDKARRKVGLDEAYFEKLLQVVKNSLASKDESHRQLEVYMNAEEGRICLEVLLYDVDWSGNAAIAMVITDISSQKTQLAELESHAYKDSLTGLYNRFYGMSILTDWLDKKRHFALAFADLDNLKYVNDNYGHSEGDKYILSVATHSKSMPENTITSRIGGDEYMFLIPEMDEVQARTVMEAFCDRVSSDAFLKDKGFKYSISYGIVAMDEHNKLTSSEILHLADERMYENKKAKKARVKEGKQENAPF